MARLTRHHAISPTRTRSRLYRDWRAGHRTCSRCSCYLTWHLRQETVVQTGSLASACALGRSKSAISKAPVNQAPLTDPSRREPRSGLSLLARNSNLLHAANCSHARAPLPAHGTESARASSSISTAMPPSVVLDSFCIRFQHLLPNCNQSLHL
jgi:hypothetical protein